MVSILARKLNIISLNLAILIVGILLLAIIILGHAFG